MPKKITVNLIGGPADGLKITTQHHLVKIVTANKKRAIYRPPHDRDMVDGGLWLFDGYEEDLIKNFGGDLVDE